MVLVTYCRRDLVAECLEHLEAARRHVPDSEVIIVDNGSADGTADWLRSQYPSVKIIDIPANIGFTRAVMRGIRSASGTWLLLINDDVLVEPEAISSLLDAALSDSDVFAVAAQMRFADQPRTINSAGLTIDRLGIAADRLIGAPVETSETITTEVFGASGGAALYDREKLMQLGGFDESFFGYMEDADVAWRARMRGWRALYAPKAIVYHRHSATFLHGSPEKYFLVGRNRVRVLAKNASRRQLLIYGIAMLVYDAAYVSFVAVRRRTLAPVRGRIRGLLEWRRYRRSGTDGRRPVDLMRPHGFAAALRRHRTWTNHVRG